MKSIRAGNIPINLLLIVYFLVALILMKIITSNQKR